METRKGNFWRPRWQHVWRTALIGLLGMLCASHAFGAAPMARHGEIDLRALETDQGAVAPLSGEWEFYWQQLLTPEDFSADRTPPSASKLHVPQRWSKTTLQDQAGSGRGHATYRLRILPPPEAQALTLQLPEIQEAYALWVDGRMLAQAGTVGVDMASEKVGSPEIRMVTFASHGTPVELVLQTSSHHYSDGGMGSAIRLGAPEVLAKSQMLHWGAGLAVAAALLVMFLYHLALFISRRSNPAPLFLGIYCLLRAINTLCSGTSDWSIWLLFPEADGALIDTLGMACLLGSMPLLQAFFNSLFPAEFPRKWMLVLVVTGMILTGFGAYTDFNSASMLGMAVYMAIVVGYSIFNLIRAWRVKRVGALLLLSGYVLLGLSAVNDFLNGYHIIQSMPMAPIATLAFILCQSFALARWFSMALTSVEKLSGQLELQNTALQDEMAERARLEREIERVSDEERRAISRALHDGLCQELTAARLHCSLLQPSDNAQTARIELGRLSALLGRAVDQAYELSRGLWPVENDTHNLAHALEELAEKARALHRLEISVRCEAACVACSNDKATNIYHIAKEALQNITKHAHAHKVNIVLEGSLATRSLTLQIEDDGIGPNTRKSSPGGLGTRIMAHRASMMGGHLTVSERPGGGTLVRLSIACATGNIQQEEICCPCRPAVEYT
ncbi:7TM diverse intracellular signaling domain-containing protein [Uliginosibacterium sp. 31-16]|uniref:sensor histidine kinase n=1 Tax=Uliginosibacterium sp. 31-16 TaxID=3068315 RepID=UPI00273FA063|nr:7TM diverse intracellular signaling domain-containing protein [Uliginosibacterium sp. 31-16]MDP5238237.1 7TM diverse intracellular signaling domain-containing protein [Uliginosibacterium sp. 31-16]